MLEEGRGHVPRPRPSRDGRPPPSAADSYPVCWVCFAVLPWCIVRSCWNVNPCTEKLPPPRWPDPPPPRSPARLDPLPLLGTPLSPIPIPDKVSGACLQLDTALRRELHSLHLHWGGGGAGWGCFSSCPPTPRFTEEAAETQGGGGTFQPIPTPPGSGQGSA